MNGFGSHGLFCFGHLPAYTAPARDPDSTEATYYRVGDSVTLVLVKGGVITGRVTKSEMSRSSA